MYNDIQHRNTQLSVDAVRAKFERSRQTLIAKGTEAEVYALDADRVLKIYRRSETLGRQRDLQGFYQRALTDDITFDLPRILEVGTHASVVYSVEQRLGGVPLASLITHDPGTDPTDLYLSAAFDIERIGFAPAYGGRTPWIDSVRSADHDWNAFIRERIAQKSAALHEVVPSDTLRQLGPVSDLVAFFGGRYTGPDLLIHGDFHPGNVLVNGGRVSAVIDFGAFTMFGDPLYNIATACGFYSMYEVDQLATRARLLRCVAGRVEPAELARIHAYLLYVAFTTCDLYPDDVMPIEQTGHFKWAMSVLADRHLWASLCT